MQAMEPLALCAMALYIGVHRIPLHAKPVSLDILTPLPLGHIGRVRMSHVAIRCWDAGGAEHSLTFMLARLKKTISQQGHIWQHQLQAFTTGFGICIPRQCGAERGYSMVLRKWLLGALTDHMRASRAEDTAHQSEKGNKTRFNEMDFELAEIVPAGNCSTMGPCKSTFPNPNADAVKFWNAPTADSYSHRAENENILFRQLAARHISMISQTFGTLSGHRLLDYGIGCASLGSLALLQGATTYIGVDISQRSLSVAHENLKEWHDNGRVVLVQTPTSFKFYAPDIITSFAVIWHLSSMAELLELLANMNQSGARGILMNARLGDVTFVPDKPFSSHAKKKNGAICSVSFLVARLSCYELIWESQSAVGNFVYYTAWRRRAFGCQVTMH